MLLYPHAGRQIDVPYLPTTGLAFLARIGRYAFRVRVCRRGYVAKGYRVSAQSLQVTARAHSFEKAPSSRTRKKAPAQVMSLN